MAWKIHISSPTASDAILKLGQDKMALLAEKDRTEVEGRQISAGASCMLNLLQSVPEGHEVTGWMEGRYGPRYQMGEEQIGHFGCHLTSRQRA